jgi:diguanylate cyclase
MQMAMSLLGTTPTLLLPAAIGTFLLVNLLCACVALGVGFAAGVWFFGAKMARPDLPQPTKKPPTPAEDAKLVAERNAMAASRVADLAQNVASDVGDHAAKMKAISADLAGIDRQSEGANAAVFTAMDQIIAANSELQQRLEQAEKQLAVQAAEIKTHESEARTDSLTGLSNRRAFDDELKRRLNEWLRDNTPSTLILLDIDFFKKFNDTHGHQVGDQVLRCVAKVLAKQSRERDVPCRYGGEEFAIILPATDAICACKVADRVRAAIEASTIDYAGKSLKVTCSLGVAQLQAADDVARLIRRADDALYTSKKAGRNCGHWHTGVEHLPITQPETGEAHAPAAEPIAPASAAGVASSTTDDPLPQGATFVQMLKRRVTESHRFGVPLSVLYLKIEDYDLIGRKYGNAIARQMIDTAVPALERTLREMDVLTRLENGELVVMLPGSSQSEANRVAKRMCSTTSTCVLPVVDHELQILLQFAAAELKPGETAQELITRARQEATATVPRTAGV